MRVQIFRSISFLIVLMLCTNVLLAQSTIPNEYRGDQGAVARGVLDGNNIITNYRNHGEMARFGDLPWGEWYSNICDRFDENCESSGAY